MLFLSIRYLQYQRAACLSDMWPHVQPTMLADCSSVYDLSYLAAVFGVQVSTCPIQE
jgi:hypothetical protein